jgi:ABC-type uncharacterized transport system involved in gliding motility auxiliary subunit
MTKKQTLIQQTFSGVLFIAVLVMLGWLSTRYKAEIDWTAGKRNSISVASQKQLAAMTDPISFIAFIPSGDAEARNGLQFDIARYQRFKKNVTLTFVDPSAQPQKVRELNVSSPGELVVEYQGRHENLHASTEPIITTALQRLTFAGEQWVVFLEGHGERSVGDSETQSGFGKFADALRGKGLKVQTLNLAKTAKIPDNTSVLVLAGTMQEPLTGETQLLEDYVAQGGSLLWLNDSDSKAEIAPLAKALSITWQKGVVIDPVAQELQLPAGFYVPDSYPPNPVTQGFDQYTLYPLAEAVSADKGSTWNPIPLLNSSDHSWLETNPKMGGVVQFDGNDIKGPLNVGLILMREHKDGAGAEAKSRAQRIALIGNANFLNNTYLAQQGNQQFGINVVQWLASRDSQLNIDIPKAPDTSLSMPGWAVAAISITFVALLPLLLIGYGVGRWVVRRRK